MRIAREGIAGCGIVTMLIAVLGVDGLDMGCTIHPLLALAGFSIICFIISFAIGKVQENEDKKIRESLDRICRADKFRMYDLRK